MQSSGDLQAGDYFIVNFSSSEAAALKESRVLAKNFDYIQVVATTTEEQ
jgi:hypothetical protein